MNYKLVINERSKFYDQIVSTTGKYAKNGGCLAIPIEWHREHGLDASDLYLFMLVHKLRMQPSSTVL